MTRHLNSVQQRLWCALLVGIMLIMGGALPTAAAPPLPSAAPHMPDQLLVKFGRGVPAAVQQAVHGRAGARVERTIPAIGVQVVRVTSGRLLAALAVYRAESGVQYAEPNFIVHTSLLPNDPSLPQQWAVQKIQAPAAWDIQAGDPSVVIAVVDTGIDASHPDLASQIVAGHNIIDGSDATADDNGHGTHVAGIAAAATNNGIGIAGIGFRSHVMPVKVLDATGSGSNDNVANGIIYAADHGARVVNLSLGGTAYSQAIQDATDYAYSKGLVVVAAAGNDGTSTVEYPAANLNVTAVAATDSNDQRASFSNYGSHIALAAPGVGILSTVPTNGCPLCDPSGYHAYSGTSMATPHVAGLAALLLAQNPARTPDQVRAGLQRSADDLGPAGWDEFTGAGRINAYRALLGAVTGRITSAVNGAALGGAQVQVLQNGTSIGSASTALDGTYLIANLPAGVYDVRVTANTYSPGSVVGVVVSNGQEATVDVALQPAPGSVAGRVTDTRSTPLAGATVQASQAGVVKGTATTAADGTYQINNLSIGSYDVSAAATGYVSATRAAVQVTSSQVTSNVNFSLARSRGK